MPTHASADPEIKQQYLNGHFCYAFKAGVLTNGLGIIRAIEFYDKDYFTSHPEIERYKKTDAPDEDKSVGTEYCKGLLKYVNFQGSGQLSAITAEYLPVMVR